MVIVVAEGAGIHLVDSGDLGKDKSGNAKLPPIGQYLSDRINHWAEFDEKMEVNLKVWLGLLTTAVSDPLALVCRRADS